MKLTHTFKKLIMEEELQKIIDKLNEAYLPQNVDCDGGYCMGCWKDVIREAIRMIEKLKQ